MSLKERIQDDLKMAMRARDKAQVAVLRLIMAALKQREVDERITLNDGDVISVLERMIKQRRESIEHYQKGGREDLAAQEVFEIDRIQTYLPQALSVEETESLVTTVIAETGAQSQRDMGKVMSAIKGQSRGRVDMTVVSRLAKARLSS